MDLLSKPRKNFPAKCRLCGEYKNCHEVNFMTCSGKLVISFTVPACFPCVTKRPEEYNEPEATERKLETNG